MLRVSGLRVRTTACALLTAVALASCGQQDGGETAEGPSASESSSSPAGEGPPGAPECADVWQEGGDIPRAYQGCVDETGAYVERDVLGCSSGQRMVRYADHFWGVLGGTVNEADGSLDEDRDYRESMRNCSA
ncbi:hypothetical protein [Nocardioides sp. GXQ0305]|uniref:hypothetical protein n=1 Tax=Nocardioides sp. GXQ0305 TaxID=3423912 RepID=UPI003D7E4AC0